MLFVKQYHFESVNKRSFPPEFIVIRRRDWLASILAVNVGRPAAGCRAAASCSVLSACCSAPSGYSSVPSVGRVNVLSRDPVPVRSGGGTLPATALNAGSPLADLLRSTAVLAADGG